MTPAMEQLLAESLHDFQVRLRRGERPSPERYRDDLGPAYEEFCRVVEVEGVFDDLLEPPPEPTLPRAFGAYTLLREVARGGMGVVYEAQQRATGRRVAVKVLQACQEDHEDARERFRREAEHCARVDHPHIVRMIEAGEVQGQAFYAMELLEGPTLAQVARMPFEPDGAGRPSPAALCAGLADVARALQALHEAGVYHRDVKPSNVVLQPDGRTVLADFGLARSVASATLTRTDQILGSPLYMSPEQMRGQREAVDGRADVYGLGATLYEVLTGRPIFEGRDTLEIYDKVLHQRPAPPRRVRPDVPAACEAIALKALEKRPEDRYASAEAMARDLEAFAAGEAVRGRPVSPLRRAWRRWHRAGIAAAAALLVGLGAWAWQASRDGVLRIHAIPGPVSVYVGGALKGTAPLDVELPPETVEIRLETEHFEPATRHVRVRPAHTDVLHEVLRPMRDAEGQPIPAAVEKWARALEVSPLPRERDRARSTADGAWARALFPRGMQRRPGPDRWHSEPTTAVSEQGRVLFLAGGKRLHEAPLDPRVALGPIPAAAHEAIEAGREVTWTYEEIYEDGTGEAWTARFRLAAPEVEEAIVAELATIDRHTETWPAWFRAYVRARRLIDAGFAQAGYEEARDAAGTADPEARVPLLLTQAHALRVLELEEGDLYDRLLREIDALPKEEVEAWLEPAAR